jgi:hypothetical protein
MSEEVKKSRLTILKEEAIDADDFSLALELAKIEKDMDFKLLEARNKGLVIGFGSAIVCVVMGGVVTKVIISKGRTTFEN